MEAILFRKCLGYTDSDALSTVQSNPETGETQLTGCSNMTVTDDGAIQTIPATQAVLTHTSPVTSLSAGSRLFFADGIDTYEVVSGSSVKRFPLAVGPMIHTPIDARLSTGTKVYKSANPSGAMTEAVVGANPGPETSVAYAGMPVFGGGFVLGGRLYAHQGKFLHYSEPYRYDLWNQGDGYVPHAENILQSGAVPGCSVSAHAGGVSVTVGGDPLAAAVPVPRRYPCAYLPGTLYSGFLSRSAGYGHVFMCDDGVYMVAVDGAFARISDDALDDAGSLNNVYHGAIVADGKYLAYGDNVAVEFDLSLKAVMLRSSGVTAACVIGDTPHLAVGNSIETPTDTFSASGDCSFTLPCSALGAGGRKTFEALYLTGEFVGELEITLLDHVIDGEPERWTIGQTDLGVVHNHRVKLPRATVGSRTSMRFSISGGGMRVEEVRAMFSTWGRS